MTGPRLRYVEDFAPGLEFELGRTELTAERIVAFSEEHDPQPFHLDDRAAVDSPFGRLVASGWQTATAIVRLWLDYLVPRGGRMVSPAVEVEWPRAVAAGDTVHARARIADVTPSRSNPARGWIHVELEGRNQAGEIVCVVRARSLLDRAPA